MWINQPLTDTKDELVCAMRLYWSMYSENRDENVRITNHLEARILDDSMTHACS